VSPDRRDARDIEAVRSYVEGTLSPAERSALDARAARDPDLAALLSAYGTIHAATHDAPPALPIEFDDLVLDDAPPAPAFGLRRGARVAVAAAAAALLLGVGVYLAATSGAERPEPVVLASVPLDPVVVPEPPALPPEAASYATSDERGLSFLRDVKAAKALALFTGRPLVVVY
jgi:hypothetical protein